VTDRSPPYRWDGHQLLLAPREQALTGLVRWAEYGLARGDKLLYAGSWPATVEDLVATLASAGLDASAAADDGRLEVVDRARFCCVTGCPAPMDEARRQGFPGVRTFGGPAAAAGLLDGPACDRFERTLDRLCTTHGVTVVCCYDAAMTTAPDELRRAVTRHPPRGPARSCTPTARNRAGCAWSARSTRPTTECSRRCASGRSSGPGRCWSSSAPSWPS
jgi:hypothetical protein